MDSNWRIRRAISDDVSGIAKVNVDSWRTTYEGIIQEDFLDDMSYEKSKERWESRFKDPFAQGIVYVAEDGNGQIVGYAYGGFERSGDTLYDGELYAIYLLRGYQRKGIGKQLFYQIVSHLLSINLQGLLIWVLNDNPSRYFYESLGGQLVRERSIEIGGQRLQLSAYGWNQLNELKVLLQNR